MKTTLITDSNTNIELYKIILKDHNINQLDTIDLLEDSKSQLIKNSLIIIDLKSKQSFEKLKLLKFKDDSFVILITPFIKKYLVIPDSLEKVKPFFLTKPLNIKKFEKILIEYKSSIKKSNYLKSIEDLLIYSVDESPLRIAVYDINGKLIYANQNYIDANDIKKLDDVSFDDITNCNLDFKEIIYYLKAQKYYTKQKEQDERWYKSHFYYINNQKNIVHQCTDITTEKVRFDNLRKVAKFFEQTNEAVVITDEKGVILAVNESFCKITGYPKDEVMGKPTSILSSGVHGKDFYENFWDSLKYYGKWQGEIWNRRKNGEIYPEWLSISKMIDEESDEINYMAIFTDISSLKEADKKLHFYANHDHLTGLLNRVQFDNMMTHTIESCARNHKKFALLFIDLDYFKDVNDTYGHDVGDFVLKEVASRIRSSLRKEDIIARIGGDEFTAIITNVNSESDILEVGNSINNAIKQAIVIEDKSFYLSLSIGISIYPRHGITSTDLSKNADQAMYEVKKKGRDGVLIYNQNLTSEILNKITLKNDLKKAIEDKKLEVYYQPVFDMKSKKIFGAEALVRWNHPKKGFIPPDKFIQIAEKHGMIIDLGKLVMQTVFEDLPSILRRFKIDFKVAINISSKEFSSDGFEDKLIKMAHDFNIDFRNIELEITETYIMQNHNFAAEKMDKLKEAGFSLAIDDFGTGYSSLSYLKTFPIDKLKIDKSFVIDILNDDDDKAIVETIVNIAKVFNLEVQAEGVETISHLNMLESLGCDIAQGYYYSKPIPLNDFLNFKVD